MENFIQLSEKEMKNTNGGEIITGIATALGIYGGICALSYGLGYVCGKLFK